MKKVRLHSSEGQKTSKAQLDCQQQKCKVEMLLSDHSSNVKELGSLSYWTAWLEDEEQGSYLTYRTNSCDLSCWNRSHLAVFRPKSPSLTSARSRSKLADHRFFGGGVSQSCSVTQLHGGKRLLLINTSVLTGNRMPSWSESLGREWPLQLRSPITYIPTLGLFLWFE